MKEYPYRWNKTKCRAKEFDKSNFTSTGFRKLKRNDPYQLKAALNVGPVAMIVSSKSPEFRYYKGGVIKTKDCGTTGTKNHAVLAIGYGNDWIHGEYVLIKNSWGEYWGQNGFGKISLTQEYSRRGVCGIYDWAMLVNVDGETGFNPDNYKNLKPI